MNSHFGPVLGAARRLIRFGNSISSEDTSHDHDDQQDQQNHDQPGNHERCR